MEVTYIGGDNMKKLMLSLFSLLCLFAMGTGIAVSALTIQKLPIAEKSKQWEVEITKPDEDDPHLLKAKRGLYNVYSLNLRNISKDARDVKVQLFRNEPNSFTRYGLLPTIEPSHLSRTKEVTLHISNFGLSEKATELTVLVTWKEKNHNRDYQETFTFQQNKRSIYSK